MSEGLNLHDLMLLYLADALDEHEHALVKARLAEGDPEAHEALREARELFAALPVALDPVTPSDAAGDNLMRMIEADQLRAAPAKPAPRQPAPTPKPAPQAHAPSPAPEPIAFDPAPGPSSGGFGSSWVAAAALAAGFAIAASVLVFFLARWDVQGQLREVRDEAAALELETGKQQQRLADQADTLAQQAETLDAQARELSAQEQALREQARLIEAQRDRLAAQDEQIERVAFSIQAQEAVTDELRALFANQQNDLMVLMRREDEARRVLSLLSAPRLEAYVLAGTPDAPAAAGRMFYDPQSRRLRLTVAGLDPAAAGRTYQAWFVLDEGEGAPVSLGTFNTNAQGEAVFEATLNQAPSGIALAAVSVEPVGGVPAPTGAIVIAGGSQ